MMTPAIALDFFAGAQMLCAPTKAGHWNDDFVESRSAAPWCPVTADNARRDRDQALVVGTNVRGLDTRLHARVRRRCRRVRVDVGFHDVPRKFNLTFDTNCTRRERRRESETTRA